MQRLYSLGRAVELAGLPGVSCVKTVDFAHFDALTFSEVLIARLARTNTSASRTNPG